MLNIWLIVGLAGQLLFAARFIVQWICSERRGESYIPIIFWYLSLGGGVILLAYAISRRDPVFILGQTGGVFVYMRNLYLIQAKKKEAAASYTGS